MPNALQALLGSIQARILLLTCGIALFTAVALGTMNYIRMTDIALANLDSVLGAEARLFGVQVGRAYSELENDVAILSNVPPISGIVRARLAGGVDPTDNLTESQWRGRLESIFVSMMQRRPFFTQMRFIGVADDGREIVRVNRTASRLERVAPAALQQKAQEPYFREAIAAGGDGVLYLPLTYNREHGVVSEPKVATLRVMLPIRLKSGDLFGFLAINIDYSAMIGGDLRSISAPGDLLVVNDEGDYFFRPKGSETVDFDFHESAAYSPTPLVEELLRTRADEGNIERDGKIVGFVRVPIQPGKERPFALAAIQLEKSTLLAPASRLLRDTVLAAGAIFLIAVAGAALVSRRFSNALVESEARAQAVLTTVVDGIITIDTRGTILSYNPACERIFQYVSSEVVGENVKMLMPEGYSSAHDGYLRHYAETGEKRVIGIGREVEGRRKDGSTFPLDLSVSEVKLKAGTIFTGIVRDISERKAVDRALLESEARVQSVLDTVVDGIITINEFGIVQSYNKACERIFGYRPQEIVGGNIKRLMPPNFASEHDGYLAHYMSTGERRIIGIGREVEGQRKDGSRFPLDLAVSQVEINGRPLFTGIVRDISQRRAAEEALRASEERYDMVIRGMSAGFWEWDIETNEVFWSDVTRKIIGVSGELAPDPNFFSTRRHPDDAAYFEQKFQAVLRGEGTLDVQYRFRRMDDKFIWLHVTATCSFDDDGKPVRMVGSLSDVTAKREFEAEREHLISALAQSNRELDQFAYVASHDLKAPLRVIDNASSWLEEDLSDRLDDDSRENLDLLRNRVRRMDRLLDDLLEYSRVGRKTDSRWQETATGAQMQEEMLALVPSREGFEVVFDPSFADIRVTIMPLKQILINLIGNALKHHDRDTGQVVVKAERQGRKYLISVIDDGPGIPDEFREQIFKMFQTLKPRDRVEGSGMGLAIVRKHIDVLGEDIRVERAGERGSIFCFTYPRSTEVPRTIED